METGARVRRTAELAALSDHEEVSHEDFIEDECLGDDENIMEQSGSSSEEDESEGEEEAEESTPAKKGRPSFLSSKSGCKWARTVPTIRESRSSDVHSEYVPSLNGNALQMDESTMQQEGTQADFIREELNFNIDTKDPMTKASLNDHLVDEWVDILGNGQLKKKIIKKGKDGTRPNRGEICTLNVTGKLEDSNIVEEYENLVIQLGDMEVIQGLDLAIALMDVDEVAEITVDPRFAYGKQGKKPIPSDATITYMVELKAVELEPEIETLSISQRREISNKKRERGNWWFVREELPFAIQCYRRALEYLSSAKSNTNQNEEEDSFSDAELQILLEDRIKVHNNLAAALIKTEAYDAALENVEHVLRCQPQNVKALFRKGTILRLKGEYAKAYAIFTEMQRLNPEMKICTAELITLKDKLSKDAKKEKHLYRKMLGVVEDTKNSSKNAKPDDKKKFTKGILWTLVGAASVAAVSIFVHKFIS